MEMGKDENDLRRELASLMAKSDALLAELERVRMRVQEILSKLGLAKAIEE